MENFSNIRCRLVWSFGWDRMEPKSKSKALVSMINYLVRFGCTRTRAGMKAFIRVSNAFSHLCSPLVNLLLVNEID